MVTEERTITVQVRHEEVRLEIVPYDEPVPDDEDTVLSVLDLPELVLSREEIVVTKQLIPTERVHMRITPVTERRTITSELRQEQITLDDSTSTTDEQTTP